MKAVTLPVLPFVQSFTTSRHWRYVMKYAAGKVGRKMRDAFSPALPPADAPVRSMMTVAFVPTSVSPRVQSVPRVPKVAVAEAVGASGARAGDVRCTAGSLLDVTLRVDVVVCCNAPRSYATALIVWAPFIQPSVPHDSP